MQRPRHDLTLKAIRRHWETQKEEPNIINGSINNHHYKSLSVPLLNDDFELLSNNVINIDHDQHTLPLPNDRGNQRSDSMADFSVPPVSKIQRSHHHQDLSKILHSCDMEMIRSELRIIISQLAKLTHHLRRQEEHDDESQDWKFVAMVIDRLCLVIFTIFMILFTSLTFFSIPDVFKFR
jgi:hypothetical protein